MQIKFYSLNVDGKWVTWKFSDINELMDIFWGDSPDLPSNDDAVKRIFLDNEPLFLENVISNPTFYDLAKLLGITT